MRWDVKGKQKPWEWHRWYAWYPVRIPLDRYSDGVWVWREVIWRKHVAGWAGATYISRETQEQHERRIAEEKETARIMADVRRAERGARCRERRERR